MARSIDRFKRFLGSKSGRIKFFRDREIKLLSEQELSVLKGKTKFQARIVGLPRPTATRVLNFSGGGAYIGSCKVRLLDIDQKFLPDPADKSLSANEAYQVLINHPDALISSSVGTEVLVLGSLVECEFEEVPGNRGKLRGLVITKILSESDVEDYQDSIITNLTKGGVSNLAELFKDGYGTVTRQPLDTSNLEDNNLDYDSYEQIFSDFGYVWSDILNIVGVRNTLSAVSNKFNDELWVFYKDETGKKIAKSYTATTVPGFWIDQGTKHSYYKPGIAIMKPGQYIDAYIIGIHGSKYEAIVNHGTTAPSFYRDYNQDANLDLLANTIVNNKYVGLNIHSTKDGGGGDNVFNWSEGCQVLKNWGDFQELMQFADSGKARGMKYFSYTLFNDVDISQESVAE